MDKSTIEVTSHPPERRRRSSGVVLNCGCCCCCCCCLHTLGGIVGAAIAPAFGKNRGPIQPRYRLLVEEYEFHDFNPTGITTQPSAEPAPSVRQAPKISGVALYWWLMLALIFGSCLLGMAPYRGDGIGMAILGLALGMPALQLLASFIAALVVIASIRDDKKFQLLQIGKITLGCVIGTVLGILAMVGMAGGAGLFR